MFLSASINLFNGEELLVPLLKNLRPEIDHISVVYQVLSYWGNSVSEDVVVFVKALQEEGWIDEIVSYDPTNFPGLVPKEHEARKRTLGADLARQAGATHLMSVDVDEFYRADELRRAKEFIRLKGFDVTACRVQDYHSRSTYKCTKLAQYRGIDLFVPFICRVCDGMNFDPSLDFFCPVDPSRRVRCEYPYAFAPHQLVMHHMTTVRGSRQSLVSKFVNACSRSMFSLEDPGELAELVWRFDPLRHSAPSVSIVPDEFGIAGIREEFRAHPKEMCAGYSTNLGGNEIYEQRRYFPH